MPPRSYCPINLGLEIFGDTWTLLVLRDLMFGGKRHFRELLQSDEGISSNILADRLKRLVDRGILTKRDDPTHKQKAIYSLTERGIALLPVLLEIGAWSRVHLPEIRRADPHVLALNRSLVEDREAMRRKMAELRRTHLDP
jgi:DNA-binding HxlR family transcriptional regulator